MYQKRGIAFRRHHFSRLKAKRVREHYWGRGFFDGHDWCPGSLGVAVDTPKPCSCWMCANSRGLEGETLAERRNDIALQDWD